MVFSRPPGPPPPRCAIPIGPSVSRNGSLGGRALMWAGYQSRQPSSSSRRRSRRPRTPRAPAARRPARARGGGVGSEAGVVVVGLPVALIVEVVALALGVPDHAGVADLVAERDRDRDRRGLLVVRLDQAVLLLVDPCQGGHLLERHVRLARLVRQQRGGGVR